MRAVVAIVMLGVLLLPAAVARPAGASESFTLGPTQGQALRLTLAKPADVRFSILFEAGYVQELTLDGPGKCDLTIDASAGGPAATMGSVLCKALPAGAHDLELRMGIGYAKGSVVASKGTWA